jgi:hypothetical protein
MALMALGMNICCLSSLFNIRKQKGCKNHRGQKRQLTRLLGEKECPIAICRELAIKDRERLVRSETENARKISNS